MAASIDRTDSSLITISTLNELHKFYTTGNGQRCASKSLILNNIIQFRLDLFPNGQRKEQSGYVQFIVVSNKLPSNIKSIAVLCRLFCKQAKTLYKEIKIFNKGNEAISWPIYYLHQDECKYITYYNDRNQLQFGCDIELLQIKYHNNSVINNLKLKIRKNSVKNINSHNKELFSYATLRTNSQIQYEWTIDKNIGLFKHARNGKAYYSNDINNIWCLCCYPNGQYQHNEGQLLLSLKLIRLPPKIKCIQTHISLQIQHKNQSNNKPQTISFSYSENEHIWATGPFPTFDNILSFIPLKFIIVIEIQKLFQDVGKNKGREISRTNWTQYGIDILGVPEKSNMIDDGNHEFESNHESMTCTNRQKYSKSMVFYKQQSQDKLRSIRSFSQRSINNPPATCTSPAAADDVTSNTFPQSNRLSTTTVEYSTYSAHPSSSYRSSLQISPSLYKKITPTQTQTQTPAIIEEEQQEKTFEPDIHQIKFKEWLNEIGLNKYFDDFERNENADIRDIISFDHETLIGIGIRNKPHRNRIVEASSQYAALIKEFDDTLEKNNVLNNFGQDLRRNGILTLNDLEAVSMNELKMILTINKSEHGNYDNYDIKDIWNLIHPETHLKSAINDLEERHKKVMNEMDKLMIQISEMNNKIETSNYISVSNIIKEKYEKIVEKTYRQLTQHHTQLNEFKSNKYSEHFGGIHAHQRLKKSTYLRHAHRHSTNTVSSINSSSKESMNTVTTCTTDNYAASHLTGSNTAAGIDEDINRIKYKLIELIIYGYLRITAVQLNINIPFEIIDFCINYYQK